MQSPELVPALIYKLADSATAMASVRALIAHGSAIERTLFKVLHNPREDIRVRRRIPRVLERIGQKEAFEQLVAALDTKDPELRTQIARAAARIRERQRHLKMDESQLNRAIRDQIKQAYQALNVVMDLELPPDHLLSEAMVARHRSHLALAFGLLEIRYPARTIQLVHANLDSENKAIRANALEVVDNVLSKDESRLLLPLLEDHSLDEKVQKGRENFSTERRSKEEWLERLIDDPHPWVVSCTLHHIAQLGLTGFGPQVRAHLDSRDPIVKETALLTLDKLIKRGSLSLTPADTDTLRQKLRVMVQEDVPEVRRAAGALLRTVGTSGAKDASETTPV